MVDGGPPELLLRGEVVVDLGLMGAGPLGDSPGRRTGETVGGELYGRGVDEVAGAVLGGTARPGASVVGGGSTRHINRQHCVID